MNQLLGQLSKAQLPITVEGSPEARLCDIASTREITRRVTVLLCKEMLVKSKAGSFFNDSPAAQFPGPRSRRLQLLHYLIEQLATVEIRLIRLQLRHFASSCCCAHGA